MIYRELIHPADIAIFQSVFQTDTFPPQDQNGYYILNSEQHRFFSGIQKARDDEKDFVLSLLIDSFQSLQTQGVHKIDTQVIIDIAKEHLTDGVDI